MPTVRPCIGVTSHRYQLEGDMCTYPGYTESVLRAGGVPLVIPMLSNSEAYNDILSLFDGFLLTGSEADVYPELYGKTPPPGNFSDEWRDTQDFVILRHAAETGKPVFGVCRGCQVMNVFRGGTLAIHFSELVETEVLHDGEDGDGPPAHTVTIVSGTQLSTLVSEEIVTVNSLHRQVCDQLGKQVRVTARSEDGLVEAIEDESNPARFYAVQWHPERSPQGQDALSLALFAQLVHEATAWSTDKKSMA